MLTKTILRLSSIFCVAFTTVACQPTPSNVVTANKLTPVVTLFPTVTAVPTPSPTALSDAQACMVNNDVSWKGFAQVKPARRMGWCEAMQLNDKFVIEFPANWQMQIAGPGGDGFNLTSKEPAADFRFSIFPVMPQSSQLADADRAQKRGFEMMQPSPLVSSDERVISKTLKSVGAIPTLALTTQTKSGVILRYFAFYETYTLKTNQRGQNLVAFVSILKDSSDTAQMQARTILESIVATLKTAAYPNG